MSNPKRVVLTLLGTRPEVIKLNPVLKALAARSDRFESVVLRTGQHTDLVDGLVRLFEIETDYDLKLMRPGQTPLEVAHRLLEGLDPLLDQIAPDIVLVQGDTTTAMAGALGAFYRGVAVGHVEAGLRTADPRNPFPEEMNRRLITRLADLHFAATPRNEQVLLDEGVAREAIFLTGNPVVDSLRWVVDRIEPSERIRSIVDAVGPGRLIVLTTHRRESFGDVMSGNLRVLREFVDANPDVQLAFPIHPNPHVKASTDAVLAGSDRIHLLPPLDYPDFTYLMSRAWLLCSDSGGVQEEAPSLGIPLLILRRNTERPEAVESGVARLVDGDADHFRAMLAEAAAPGSWAARVAERENPFGRGDAGERIVEALDAFLP